jgi:hypothetical protein
MDGDLIALVVALTLGAAVVVVGLQRNLSETTRNGLPRFGRDPEGATPTLGLYEGEERKRRPLSPRQLRWQASFLLLVALFQASSVFLSADSRVLHACTAALWALAAVIVLWRASSHRSDGLG